MIEAPPLDGALERAAAVLSAAPEVALACHVNPDPDALGSMLGLASFLRARGATVCCSWANDPLERPRWLAGLDVPDMLVEARDFPAEPQLMVALDTAAPDRLGGLAHAATAAGQTIVVDHHRTNPGFGSIVVLDPNASSTAELVFRLIERIGGELPDGAAGCLYAGIVADSGRFQYEATTPETLRVAAELRRHGFDHAKLSQLLFEDAPLAYLRVLAVALDRVVHVQEASLVWTYLTQADVAAHGAAMGDTDDLIDVIRVAREADVACVLKQQRDGRFKVSLRSKGGSDVGSVAQSFGGGGHRLASGYTSASGIEQTVRQIVDALARNGADG